MNEIRKIINKLHKYEDAYNKGTPLISDKEYDDLFFQLKELEEKNGIIYTDSPLHSIRYEELERLEKINHGEVPMLSLSKTKDWEELCSWVKEPAIISLKLDGLSCRLIYENGELVEAHTRGNGQVGNLITAAARTFTNIPIVINTKSKTIIDGEAIIDFNTFNEFKDKYANPRNLAAGTLNMLDTSEITKRKIKFVAWSLINSPLERYQDDLRFIEKLGFDVVPHWAFAEEVEVQDYKDIAKSYGYGIDGLVIRFDDNKYYQSLGRNEHDFNGAKAYKFYDEEYGTKLLDITYDVSRTGQLTPVAVYEDVDTGDSIINRASLHNLSIMEKLLGSHPWVGQKIKVVKQNEIIPQVVWAEEDNEYTKNYINELSFCPVCGQPTEIREDGIAKILYCANPSCEGKLANRLDHYLGKKGLDVKGISLATINKLIDWGWIDSIKDIYTLKNHRDEWIKKSGFGVTSVDKALAAIEESRKFNLQKFISALGIPETGVSASKELVKRYHTWNEFRNATYNELINISGFGGIMVNYILNYDYTEADEIYNKYMIETESSPEEVEEFFQEARDMEKSAVAGKNFVLTGTMSKSRSAITADIEAAGGSVKSSVSKNTDYLINSDVNSTTGKNKRAKELNIPIISEEELYKLMYE